MFLKTPKAVYAASERLYTAAGEVYLSTLRWYSWVTEIGTKRLIISDSESKRSSAWALLLRDENGSFQRSQSFQFLNRSLFRSSSVVMNLQARNQLGTPRGAKSLWDGSNLYYVQHIFLGAANTFLRAANTSPPLQP